jgi:hypothetical protein
MPLSQEQWDELAKASRSARSDDTGRAIVKAAQESVKPMLLEAEQVRNEFRAAKIPAVELLAKIRRCEPLDSGVGQVFVIEIIERSGALNRDCSFAEQGSFDELVQYVNDIDAETLTKTYRVGPSFQERVQQRVQNLRAIVGSVVERTGALDRLMEQYYERRGRRGVLPTQHGSEHVPIHPSENGGDDQIR